MQDKHAPKGKLRVIGVDTFEGPNADYLIGDYDTLSEAVKVCEENGGEMNPCYVFDENAHFLHKAGSF